MSFLDIASYNSYWRGYHYYTDGFVHSIEKISDTQYKGKVQGSYNNEYEVFIDLEHPRSSTCTCPHAEGKRIICKHKVALYFAVNPEEYQKVHKEVLEQEQARERYEEEKYQYLLKEKKRITEDVLTWDIERLQNFVVNTLLEPIEKDYDRMYGDDEYEDDWYY